MKFRVLKPLIFFVLILCSTSLYAEENGKAISLARAISEISPEASGIVSFTLFVLLPAKQRVHFYQKLPQPHQRFFWKYRLQQALAAGGLDQKQTHLINRTIEFISASQQHENEFQQQLKSLENEAIEAFGLEDAKHLFSVDGGLYRNSI